MSGLGFERATQDRVLRLFEEQLGYRVLGNWKDRPGNSNIEEGFLTAYLQRRGYSPAEISGALYQLRSDADVSQAGLYEAIWQAFAVLLPVHTVGVMGDGRTYEFVCALRAVTSVDGMTADFYHYDMEFLGRAATRIINEVRGINRVVYDVTSKPPGTIEWE